MVNKKKNRRKKRKNQRERKRKQQRRFEFRIFLRELLFIDLCFPRYLMTVHSITPYSKPEKVSMTFIYAYPKGITRNISQRFRRLFKKIEYKFYYLNLVRLSDHFTYNSTQQSPTVFVDVSVLPSWGHIFDVVKARRYRAGIAFSSEGGFLEDVITLARERRLI
jgi:hypothetical protein